MLSKDYVDDMRQDGRAVGDMWKGRRKWAKKKEEMKWRSQDEGSNVHALSK